MLMSSDILKISKISKKIYNASELHSDFFRTKKWIVDLNFNEVSHLDSTKFIVWQLKNYPARYCMNLFMCLTDFWQNLQIKDFQTILESLEHPKLGLSFVEFLNNYLRINSLLILNKSDISLKHKKIYFEYYNTFHYKLVVNVSNVENEIFNDMGVDLSRLISEGQILKNRKDDYLEPFENNRQVKKFTNKEVLLLKVKMFFNRGNHNILLKHKSV